MSTETGALKGIGVASAGPLDVVKGTLSPVNIPVWRDFPIIDCFKEISKGTPVVLHGDAMALAHAEQKLGAGQGLKNMLGMVVSTGVGGGLILNDQVFTGESGNALDNLLESSKGNSKTLAASLIADFPPMVP